MQALYYIITRLSVVALTTLLIMLAIFYYIDYSSCYHQFGYSEWAAKVCTDKTFWGKF